MEFTEDERSMVRSALREYRTKWIEVIDRRRQIVYNPDVGRSEQTRRVDREILERCYVLFSALDSAIEKVR